MKKKIFFSSLGCSKNLVDAEVMLGNLGLRGYTAVAEPDNAEVIIVNTCSFIEAAKKESIEVILEMADYKTNGKCKALVVSGCMAQRYPTELELELPEVDLIIGTGEYYKIDRLLSDLNAKKLSKKIFVDTPTFIHTDEDARINTSPSYMSWLKCAEGCDRHCTFCIIPSLRGAYRSRTVESLVLEAKKLVATGVKELNLIAQDLSVYGKDLDKKNNLLELVKQLEKIEGLEWIRILYYYPDDLDPEFISHMANSKKICHYIDMPIQHFSSKILKKMNRNITRAEILSKLEFIRKEMPDVVLRTSVIVGFPGETEEDFQELLQGIRDAKFDHLGVFCYSDEEGTASYKLPNKLDQEVIQERYQEAYRTQQEVVQAKNERLIGQELEVIIEGLHDDSDLLIVGRHKKQAPEIDGKTIINDANGIAPKAGDLVLVKVSEFHDYDLVGEIIKTL